MPQGVMVEERMLLPGKTAITGFLITAEFTVVENADLLIISVKTDSSVLQYRKPPPCVFIRDSNYCRLINIGQLFFVIFSKTFRNFINEHFPGFTFLA